MALRLATLEAVDRTPTTPDEWAREVDRVVAAASHAMLAGANDLGDFFRQIDGWGNPHRLYEARKRLAELVLGSTSEMALDRWLVLYETTAGHLLGALEAAPHEPVLLNYAGVLLYEIWELGGAEALFRAAAELDPELPGVKRNLRAVRARKRDGRRLRPRGINPTRHAALGARARRIAAAARRPVAGLTLSLCMIVKDEEEMLPGCLEAARPHVDEIIVVDTGSSDRTVEIAESFGAKVIHFPWNGSFSDARNVSLDAACGGWVMYLDADEHLVCEDAPRLRALLHQVWREGFELIETNYTGGDESGSAVNHMTLRIWRNRPEYRFEGRIHEQKRGNMPAYLPERFAPTDIRVLHYGYLKSRISEKEKSRRNLDLLLQESREAPGPFNAFNLGSEYLALGDAQQARTYFDKAWHGAREEKEWHRIGYVSMLAPRLVAARREAGDLESARRGAAEALAVFPDHTDVVLQLAFVERDAGNFGEAERLAKRCLEMGDAPARYMAVVGAGTYLALSLLGELAVAQERQDEAEASFARSLADYPHFVAPVLPLATAMFRRGASPEEVEAAIPADRQSALLLAATACFEAGHAEAAESWYRRVLARQAGNPVARLGLVETLLTQRRYTEAAAEAVVEEGSVVAALAASLRLFAYAAAAEVEALRGGLPVAVAQGLPRHEADVYDAWAAVLEGRPPRPLDSRGVEVALVVLEGLLRNQDFDSFARVLAVYEAAAIDPRERTERLARIYLRRGFLDSAAEEWISIASARPDAAAFVGLAQVAVARGLAAEALEFGQEAVRLDPRSAEATRLLAALEQRAAEAQAA